MTQETTEPMIERSDAEKTPARELTPETFMTLTEVANYLGLPRTALRTAFKNGDMPRGFTLGSRTRWRKRVIDSWIGEHRS